ncbi:DUF6443 domain-containing protein [Chryseobacterium defluvii]|nr:polymorphic toxin-type HINT domain-containing protein [Chryseobacterium defluvii]
MKKILFIFHIVFVAGLFYAQTPTASQNYIYSKTYLSEDGSKKSEAVQYFDGLGRLKQTVSVKSTPSGKDLVVPVFYDELGRQAKDFLPLPIITANSGIQAVSETDINSYYGVINAFREKIIDNSPLEMILEVAAPGDVWKKGSGHTIQSQYETNVSADQVKKYIITSSWADATLSATVPTVEWYGESQLMKNITVDEDGNKNIEFKNSQGQTILTRKMNGTTPVDTYYIYNIYDQLAYVITPKADVQISQNGNFVTQTILNEFCYQYKYDNRNRIVEKYIPGKGWEQMVYNKKNQVILHRDSNLKNGINGYVDNEAWFFTKYDQFGRAIYTGISRDGTPRHQIQNAVNSIHYVDYETRNSSLTLSGMTIEYTNYSYPVVLSKLLSVNYYDDYASIAPARPSTILGKATLSATPTQYSSGGVVSYRSIKGMPASSYVKNIEDDNWTGSHIWYDAEGRAIGSHSINHLGGYTKTETELDFAGAVLQSKTYHKRLSTDTEKVITENFVYDDQNRLLIHKHQIDNNPVEVLSQNTYNDLGQLEVKKVGNTIASPLQTINYTYNIHGKLTKINDPGNLGDDLFGYKINYNQVEGMEIPNSDFTDLKVKARYNGDIAEVAWKTLTQENEPLKRYGYVYDDLNRLSVGFYQKAGSESAKEYFEKIDYDIDGSITRLKRSEGVSVGNTFATMIDNLKYEYNGNKLTKVTDEQQNPSGYPYIATPNTITYDANGNMSTHLDKGISSIQYNYLNLPNQITQNSKVTSYTYRADGVKVKKLFGDIETNYLDGFQYKSTKPSETATPGGITAEPDPNEVAEMKLRIIPTAEGYYDALANQYIYNFTDHLGNVRVSYTDTNKDGVIQPRQYSITHCTGGTAWYDPPICYNEWQPGEIVENNNYYPFGMLHNYTATTQNAYQYKFNGKELEETGMYAMDWRHYMPDIGRFTGIDALSESYNNHTPYHFALNNPVNYSDPTGMYSVDANGNISTSNSVEIDALMNYFKKGNKVSSVDKYVSSSPLFSLELTIPEVVIVGRKKSGFKKGSYNSAVMASAIRKVRDNWNFQQNWNTWQTAITETKIGQSVSDVEQFLFMDIPLSFAGGELFVAGWRAAGVSRYICRPLGRLTKGLIKICFTEGTLVLVENGTKKIEDIKEGDLVWSYNENTGKRELKKVVALSRNTSSSLVKISVNGTEITCTPEHPFYVSGNWIEAKNLTKGMLLTTLDGKNFPVESINFLDARVKVYNFEVEDNHNYYVSEKNILVHNDCSLMNEFMGHFGKYVSNLDASINMGWFTGDVMELQVNAILRSSSAPRNGVMKALTETAESMARKYGMSEVRIQFNMVHNSFLKHGGWADELGYYFSREGDIVVWEKVLH